MGDMIATDMELRKLQLVKIKTAQGKSHVRDSSFGLLFSYHPVKINKPFQSGAMVNSPKKVNCCTGWNRIHSTTKSRMNNK